MRNGQHNDSLSRRDFFRRTSAVALGAAAAGAAGIRPAFGAEKELTINGLPATTLGRTGLEVTRISFGGILTTEPPVLMRVIDSGINFVHTSPYYTNGQSIRAFGQVFKKSSNRDKVVLALKARPEELDQWLKVLNTDYVDVLVPPMHDMDKINDPDVPENFEKAKKAGKCGFMGYACHSHMADILNRSRELGYYDVTLMGYGKADDPEFLAAARKANEAGIGIMAMKGLPKRPSEGLSDEELGQITTRCQSMVGSEHAHTVLASMGSFQAVDVYRNILETKIGGLINGRINDRYWALQEGQYCSQCGRCAGLFPGADRIAKALRYRMYDRDYGLRAYAREKYARLGLDSSPLDPVTVKRAERICTRSLPLRRMLADAESTLA